MAGEWWPPVEKIALHVTLTHIAAAGAPPQADVPPTPTITSTSPGQTTAPPTSTTTTNPTSAPTTTPAPVAGTGSTEINFDFKGLLAGSQSGDCNCAKKTNCAECAYGVFGYPCIADPCDQCLCGGGLATPPGSACLECTDTSVCSNGVTQDSACLVGRDGPCEPDVTVVRKTMFVGDTPALDQTDLYVEVAFYLQGPLCRMLVSWASSAPVTQIRVFALRDQYGTVGGANDTSAQCFNGVRYKVVNGVNVNYNIVQESLAYDPRFSFNGVSGLVYGAGTTGSQLSWGLSSGSTNFRDASYRCPAGVTATTLPHSIKVVILGGNIQPTAFNNALTPITAPNVDNVGTHWIMLPDRGVCVGSQPLSEQNDGSYLK